MAWKFIVITPENEQWLIFSNNKEKLAVEKEYEENIGCFVSKIVSTDVHKAKDDGVHYIYIGEGLT